MASLSDAAAAAVLGLLGPGDGDLEALYPLLGVLAVLDLEDVRLVGGEDLERFRYVSHAFLHCLNALYLTHGQCFFLLNIRK